MCGLVGQIMKPSNKSQGKARQETFINMYSVYEDNLYMHLIPIEAIENREWFVGFVLLGLRA